MPCPLCDHPHAHPSSWLGSTFYRGFEFAYVECRACRSLFCEQMPTADDLAQMYGSDYETSFSADPAIDDPKQPQRALDWLRRLGGGTFIDYGCGAGKLLADARALNWEAIGVEFDEEVARAAAQRTGARVFSLRQLASLDGARADVLHLGDVIEHLTDVNAQMPTILRLLNPGGLLLAQGPLEANANLFTMILRGRRTLRRSRTEMAPYHVMLATAAGQRQLFERFGLQQVDFTLTEVAWPAPNRVSIADLRRPRAVGMFVARRLSQTISALRPDVWGNRYFYAGRKAVGDARRGVPLLRE